MSAFQIKRKDSVFSTQTDIFFCQDKKTINCEDNYEFDENDSHITDQVKIFFETDNYNSDNESNTTLDSLKKREWLDISNILEEVKLQSGKFKISKLFKDHFKEDIINFKDILFNRIKNSLDDYKQNSRKDNLTRKLSLFNSANVNFTQQTKLIKIIR